MLQNLECSIGVISWQHASKAKLCGGSADSQKTGPISGQIVDHLAEWRIPVNQPAPHPTRCSGRNRFLTMNLLTVEMYTLTAVHGNGLIRPVTAGYTDTRFHDADPAVIADLLNNVTGTQCLGGSITVLDDEGRR